MGEQSGSCAQAGAGGARWAREGRRSLGAGVRWLDGRKRAGPTLHVCRATTRARGVGGALTFRLDLTLLARRQREDEVDPEGLDVRGRGECPDPAARYPAMQTCKCMQSGMQDLHWTKLAKLAIPVSRLGLGVQTPGLANWVVLCLPPLVYMWGAL